MTKEAEELKRTYRMKTKATQEELEENFSTVIRYGNRVLVAGYFYNKGANCYYGAIYMPDEISFNSESELTLLDISEERFEDEGHAIEWGINR